MLTEIEASVDSPQPNSGKIATLPPTADWQTQLKDAVRSVPELLRLLKLEAGDLDHPALANAPFPLRVPLSYVRRMRPGDPKDPLLRQVLPTAREAEPQPGYIDDPLAEQGQSPSSGVIHKYNGRALIVSTQACAVHCRYCFRQHFPYSDNRLGAEGWQQALAYLAERSDLNEVILSGGDPLSLTNSRLETMIADLEQLPNLTTLRFHSRTPIVLPARLDSGFLRLLRETRLKTVMVVHANHARELDREVQQALESLRDTGCILLNQAVLLRGVNDQLSAQCDLSRRLFECGTLPYYLHVLDPVRGAAHFDVPDSEARQLWQAMQAELPGYLLPRLTREVPFDKGKRWLNP